MGTFLDYAHAVSRVTENRVKETGPAIMRGTIPQEEAEETLKNLHEAFRLLRQLDYPSGLFTIEFEDEVEGWDDETPVEPEEYPQWPGRPNV